MISEPKTKYMICGPQAANYRPGTDVFFGSHYFAIV